MTVGDISRQKLRIAGVSKCYSSTVALDRTDLEMAEGEFLTLLGPSGSGKTTLLSIVAGLIAPTTGEVWIDRHRATDLPPFKRGIGMVFQNYALFPHLTAHENIAFPLRMRRLSSSDVDREVSRVLDIVKLSHVAGRLPRELSGGQQQRIALARCIVYNPSIILMDEPLGALDKNLRDHMQMEIKRLHTELGITVLYVTHDQEEALAMSVPTNSTSGREASLRRVSWANQTSFRASWRRRVTRRLCATASTRPSARQQIPGSARTRPCAGWSGRKAFA